MKRPSHKELIKKIRDARIAVAQSRVALVNQAALAADALALGYSIVTELRDVLDDLLDGCQPENYTGKRPPQRSYEQDITGLELFAFVVSPERFDKQVYLKFAYAQDIFWLVSLHENRM
jgi:hypothetical protein